MAKCYASTVVALAKTQVGYKESGTNITKYASDFDTKYPNFYNGKKQGAAWCDMFFDWLMVTSFGESEALRLTCQPKKSCGAGCKYSYGYYKNKKQVSKEPKVGSQIFFSNDGTENNINHTGIVVKVEGSKVYTIEGNKNNKVSECSYSKSNSKIYGYGHPAYDAESTTTVPDQNKSVDVIAQEVIDGKWGNGDDRKSRLEAAGYNYQEVQNKVNEILKPTPAVTKYSVTANSGLRIRKEANTSSKILCVMPYRSEFSVTKTSDGWAYGTYKSYTGWASMNYLKKK